MRQGIGLSATGCVFFVASHPGFPLLSLPIHVTTLTDLQRTTSVQVYDPISDAVYLYGGSTCPGQFPNGTWPRCVFDLAPEGAIGAFLNDTVVLDLSTPGGPVWRLYSAEDMLAHQTNRAAFPAAFGVSLAAYDPTGVLIVWSYWTGDPSSSFDVSQPFYALTLSTLQWNSFPVSSSSALPDITGVADYPALHYDANSRRIVCYVPTKRQLLLFELATGLWTVPDSAQHSAPDERSFIASALLTFPRAPSTLLIHGGFDTDDRYLYSSVFVIDLDELVWRLPVSVRNNSPSLQKHLAISRDDNRIVWWGGVHESSTSPNNRPEFTYILDRIAPFPPATLQAILALLSPSVYATLVVGCVVVCSLLWDWFAVAKPYIASAPATEDRRHGFQRDPLAGSVYTAVCSALQAVMGAGEFLGLVAIALCALSAALRVAVVALIAWSLVLTIALALSSEVFRKSAASWVAWSKATTPPLALRA
jgi:hypothetical protein